MQNIRNVKDVMVNKEIIKIQNIIIGETTENFSFAAWQPVPKTCTLVTPADVLSNQKVSIELFVQMTVVKELLSLILSISNRIMSSLHFIHRPVTAH